MHCWLASDSDSVDAIDYIADSTVAASVAVASSTSGSDPAGVSKSTVLPVSDVASTPRDFARCI